MSREIIETEEFAGQPEIVGHRLEHKNGAVCLRTCDAVELLPSGSYLVVRMWLPPPAGEPFSEALYGRPHFTWPNSAG